MAKQSDVLSADFLVKTAQEFGTPVYIYHAGGRSKPSMKS